MYPRLWNRWLIQITTTFNKICYVQTFNKVIHPIFATYTYSITFVYKPYLLQVTHPDILIQSQICDIYRLSITMHPIFARYTHPITMHPTFATHAHPTTIHPICGIYTHSITFVSQTLLTWYSSNNYISNICYIYSFVYYSF